MRQFGRYLAFAVCAGIILAIPDGARADDNAPAPQAAAPAAEPQRRGLPAPFDSPPFPGSDYPLGGSQLIGGVS